MSRQGNTKRAEDALVLDIPVAGAMASLGRNASYNAAAKGDMPTITIGKLKKVPKKLWISNFERRD